MNDREYYRRAFFRMILWTIAGLFGAGILLWAAFGNVSDGLVGFAIFIAILAIFVLRTGKFL